MKRVLVLLLFIAGLMAYVACDRENIDQESDEMARFNAWIKLHYPNVSPIPGTSIYYIKLQEGNSNTSPVEGDYVLYNFTERTLDGIAVGSNSKTIAYNYDFYDKTYHYDTVFTLLHEKNLTAHYSWYGKWMVEGLRKGLLQMKEGEKARLIFPSKYGYQQVGGGGSASIGVYTSLVYDVELIKVIKDPRSYEKQLLQKYLDTIPNLVSVNDSIYYKQIQPDTCRNCAVVANDSTVQVRYTGMFTDGFVFDSNYEKVIKARGLSSKTDLLEFKVGGTSVIKGFSMAVKLMKKGEIGKVIIPSYCAYDSAGTQKIPGFTTLVFEVELIDVLKK
jgi:FKBP-type peptidyl-prolyl cis-trans isomerase